MIAALYLFYRRSNDHFLSAFWTKCFFGLLGLLLLWIISEWASFILGVTIPKIENPLYFLGIFFIVWASCGFVIHKFTLSFEELTTIDLFPEEYIRGYKMAFYFTILTICFLFSLLLIDKQ